ncbi:LysR family transcriptional regulator [Novosphingobium sp. FSY-8]|uniref:LysR family transcriptional regulator n=1 Tax=Novosphingobium ovatum TaxID=1908523 RepID=A0ABW9XI79_9SPHN|nr:LysR family transcriptional regulator [Novosphingobium ovatum]
MDWDDLRSFLAIARQRSLSGAARELGLRQSTMSRRLAALEAKSGARLLQRTPRGYDLTPLGEAVLGNAERMEAEAIAIERAVQGRDVALSGTVRITTVEVLSNLLLPGAIAGLRAKYPGIQVDVLTDSRALSLSKREADLALRMTRFEGGELVSRRVARMPSALYASPDYLAAHGHDLTAPGHALITVAEDQAHQPEAQWLTETAPGGVVALRTNSRDTQLAAARAGIGLACLPRFLADQATGLERIPTRTAPPLREMWLGVHADLRHMPRVRALIEALDSQITRLRPLIEPD